MQFKQNDKPLKASDLVAKNSVSGKPGVQTLFSGPGKLTAVSCKPGVTAPAKEATITLLDGAIEIMKINSLNLHNAVAALRKVDIDQGITWTNTPKKYSVPAEYTFTNGLVASGNIDNLILWVNSELI